MRMTKKILPQIEVEKLENWKDPKSLAYYDVVHHTIHILEKDRIFEWLLFHENIHAIRRKYPTTILAAMMQNFWTFLLLVGILMTGTFLGYMIVGTIPLLICAFAFLYEESFVPYKSWKLFKLVKKEIKIEVK